MSRGADATDPDQGVGEHEAEPADPAADGDGPDPIGDDSIDDDPVEPAATGEPGPEAAPESEPETAPEPDGEPDGPTREMRQVAGLTSGSVTELRTGSFQFHESESDVGFAVIVHEDGGVVAVPGTAEAHVDEILLVEPTPLHDSILNVGSACFTVRDPRPEPTATTRLAAVEDNRRPTPAIPVPDLTPVDVDPTQRRSTRFGALFAARAADGDEAPLDSGWWDFLDQVRDARSQVAERHRWLHPDPEELRSRVGRFDPGLWDRTRTHPMFGRVALAYATIPWQPRFDDPERIPTELHEPIREMSQLPWVPVTANLTHGPLGIAGSRPAVLAATRHVVLSLACLSAPADLAFSIVTAKGLIEDWSWTTALPNSLFPDDTDAFPIAVADGMVHFDGAGFEHQAVMQNEMGLIALAENADDLPDYCATVLQITADGRCQVSNHMGEQIAGTPIGVTAGFAASLAAAIADAVGDDDPILDARPPTPPPERQPRPPAPATSLATEIEPDRAADTVGPGAEPTPPSRETPPSIETLPEVEISSAAEAGSITVDLDTAPDPIRIVDRVPEDDAPPDGVEPGSDLDPDPDLDADPDLDVDPDLEADLDRKADGAGDEDLPDALNGALDPEPGDGEEPVTADEFADELGELFQPDDD